LAIVPQRLFSATENFNELGDVMPTEKGLLTLASLNLPTACLPLTHRPVSADQASEIAAAISNGTFGSLHCCTECHHAGLPSESVNHLAALGKANCQACHRG
jgi:hypothetical protein